MSWVILPSAPSGVVSVSPVAREATTERRAVTTMATEPSRMGMPKARWLRTSTSTEVRITPTANQEPGTSIRSIGSSVALRRAPKMLAQPAEGAARWCASSRKKLTSAAQVMSEAPPQTDQLTMPR